ncbi:MAG: hypothetical protein HQK53_05310 [Oligoflexia bacterium]|nr:hypothetical protein [Oligoflexia bacterium]
MNRPLSFSSASSISSINSVISINLFITMFLLVSLTLGNSSLVSAAAAAAGTSTDVTDAATTVSESEDESEHEFDEYMRSQAHQGSSTSAPVLTSESESESASASESSKVAFMFGREDSCISCSNLNNTGYTLLFLNDQHIDFIKKNWSIQPKVDFEWEETHGYHKMVTLWKEIKIDIYNNRVTFIEPFFLDKEGNKFYFGWRQDSDDQTRSNLHEVAHYLGFNYANEAVEGRYGYSWIDGQKTLVSYRSSGHRSSGNVHTYLGNHIIYSITCKLQFPDMMEYAENEHKNMLLNQAVDNMNYSSLKEIIFDMTESRRKLLIPGAPWLAKALVRWSNASNPQLALDWLKKIALLVDSGADIGGKSNLPTYVNDSGSQPVPLLHAVIQSLAIENLTDDEYVLLSSLAKRIVNNPYITSNYLAASNRLRGHGQQDIWHYIEKFDAYLKRKVFKEIEDGGIDVHALETVLTEMTNIRHTLKMKYMVPHQLEGIEATLTPIDIQGIVAKYVTEINDAIEIPNFDKFSTVLKRLNLLRDFYFRSSGSDTDNYNFYNALLHEVLSANNWFRMAFTKSEELLRQFAAPISPANIEINKILGLLEQQAKLLQ